jgi:ribosome-associated toxin RatA of RatAB toxin-antitoxin module
MFVIVDDIEAYPEFLAWCKSSCVHERTDEVVQATLELQKGGVSNKFTTRNERTEFESIEISLVGGPFRHLQGGWSFTDLGDDGCKVALTLDFEFESMLVDMMFGAFFEQTCNSLVDGFTKRATQVFGAR